MISVNPHLRASSTIAQVVSQSGDPSSTPQIIWQCSSRTYLAYLCLVRAFFEALYDNFVFSIIVLGCIYGT